MEPALRSTFQDDGLSICASSKHLQTRRYLDTLRAYLLEAQRILLQLHREANAKPQTNTVSNKLSAGMVADAVFEYSPR